MKNSTFIILIVIIAGVSMAAIFYFQQQAIRVTKTLETERYSRLVAEEKAVNSVSKIRNLESELKNNEDKLNRIQTVLKEQKSVNKELEDQYQRLSKSKTDLETQLKTVLSRPPEPIAAPVVQITTESTENN